MATWADIQSWDHNAIIEAEDLIEAEVRETREIITDLEHAANDIRSQGEAPDRMRERLTEIQDKLDSRLNELKILIMMLQARGAMPDPSWRK